MKSKKSLIISLIVLLAVIGIYLVVKTSQSSGSALTVSANPISLVVGNPAPDFSAATIDGQQFSLASHKGKPVILFAMFGGCGECIPVGETLNQIQKDYALRGVAVLAVDILDGEPTSTLQQYRDYVHATFPFISYNRSVVQSYRLTAPEITYVIDKNGNIADINQGALNYNQYKQEIEKTL